jgi:hypothetical protein
MNSRDAERVKTNREELIERISRTVSEDGAKEVFPGFSLARSSKPSESLHNVYQPAFCLVAQGRKRALLGEEVFRYDPGHYLLFTVDLPLIFQIEKATRDEPYLGLRLDLDPSLVASVLMEADIKIKKGDASAKAMECIRSTLIFSTPSCGWFDCRRNQQALTFWRHSS